MHLIMTTMKMYFINNKKIFIKERCDNLTYAEVTNYMFLVVFTCWKFICKVHVCMKLIEFIRIEFVGVRCILSFRPGHSVRYPKSGSKLWPRSG